MNIRDLEYLVALAEHRHFRRAADSCHVSQPTLSGQIRKLEDELGVMLLERTSRKVLFTQAGMLLVDQARTVLREVKVLKEMASQQGETMSGPLHIGLIPTVGPYLLPHIIPMLHQTFPKLEMYLHEAQTHQLLAQLDSGKLDCVILALVKESEAFIEVPLFDEPMLLAIYEDHPWANRECVHAAQAHPGGRPLAGPEPEAGPVAALDGGGTGSSGRKTKDLTKMQGDFARDGENPAKLTCIFCWNPLS